MQRWSRWTVAWLVVAASGAALSRWRVAEGDEPQVLFNRDVRPILSDNCFQCHGPDERQRQADLRLDVEGSARALREGRRAILPGDPAGSELIRRITASDPDERMPPASTGRKLTAEQMAVLRRWIEQGARWQPHWAWIPPQRPPLPQVQRADWPLNPIDSFVLARLERESLSPSPPAERHTLLRRVTLDLTGLPPSPEEVEAFLADDSPGAFERAVDRLLASPRYGERMAVPWLNAARYADTNGYQSDGERIMWRWRDWVIEAFNDNMPFDRFTIEQLAGDLLPRPSLEQLIATGFNRNHRGNGEGGIIPEEYAVEYVADRVETTCTVWLGLTMGCSRCHDHKFDPFQQREFYQLFAYFNNVPERGKAVKFGNSPPVVKSPTRDQQRRLAELDAQLRQAEQAFEQLQPAFDDTQRAWETTAPTLPADWSVSEGLAGYFPFDEGLGNHAPPQTDEGWRPRAAGSSERKPKPPKADAPTGTAQQPPAPPPLVAGRLNRAAEFLQGRYLEAGDVGDFGYLDKFTLAAWVHPRGTPRGTILSRMVDLPQAEGYSVVASAGHVEVNLVKRWLDDAIRVQTTTTLAAERWQHVLVTYDGSRWASGIKVYFDGQEQPLQINLDELNQSFQTAEPLRIGGGHGSDGRFHGLLDEVRIYHRCLPADEAQIVATAERLADILSRPAHQRTAAQSLKLRRYYLEQAAPAEIQQAWLRLTSLRRQRDEFFESLPTTMVMQELPQPRPAYVLHRGQYDQRGERVEPGVPAVLPPLPETAPPNRLGLAQWIVSPTNPLTARVAVNRLWQQLFGQGLVRTVGDFGAQGDPPTHPELLDWLATELVASGWDVKALQRLIVTSATYRQSSYGAAAALQCDPGNLLLARAPRLRLPAEMIRDQALAAASLLVERVGGPSVLTYQPAGIWEDLSGLAYQQDHGAALYRRSLYTYWKRTAAPPLMITFDAAGRETCIVRETRTNTPLQALTLLNEVTFVEAARVMAQRVMDEVSTHEEERLRRMFLLATSRPPAADELRILKRALQNHRQRYAADPAAANALWTIGEYPRDDKLDPIELAAYTAVASMVLNLDETVTRE
jgi:mono/diheme cytochrome c family protein